MALTRGPEYAAASARGVPTGMAVDTLFVLAFLVAAPLGIAGALLIALAVWAATAALVILVLPPLDLGTSIVLYAAVTLASFVVAEHGLRIKAVPRRTTGFSWRHVAIRALFAGSIVASVIVIAQFVPPYLTGVIATFPAVLSSTLVILALGQGMDFARATGKMLILSSSNIIIYATVASATFASLGPWLGTLLAFVAAIAYIAILGKVTARIR